MQFLSHNGQELVSSFQGLQKSEIPNARVLIQQEKKRMRHFINAMQETVEIILTNRIPNTNTLNTVNTRVVYSKVCKNVESANWRLDYCNITGLSFTQVLKRPSKMNKDRFQ